jgi:hypothetical protein
MIELTHIASKKTWKFKTAESAGLWLEKRGEPRGLVYAPPEDRLALVDMLAGSPWKVRRPTA